MNASRSRKRIAALRPLPRSFAEVWNDGPLCDLERAGLETKTRASPCGITSSSDEDPKSDLTV